MNSGRSILGIFLSLTIFLSLPAFASDKSCTETFRNAKETFEARLRDLESNEIAGYIVSAAGVVAGGICYRFLKAGRFTKMSCGVGIAAIFTPGGAAWGINHRIKAGRLRDAYRLYSIYESRYNQDPVKVKEAQKMLSALGVDKQKEAKALEEFATLMDFGKLCDGEMPRSYDEALGLMKDRLHAAE